MEFERHDLEQLDQPGSSDPFISSARNRKRGSSSDRAIGRG